jgi:hypothetical protein
MRRATSALVRRSLSTLTRRPPPAPARQGSAGAALVAVLLSLGTLATLLAPLQARAEVAVIAGPEADPGPLNAAELALLYRRQKLFLGGRRAQPVNLPTQHPLRRWFSQQVLGRTPEELDGYWRDQYFNGVLPPYVLASEEAVIRFVASTPGAIGYVLACGPADRRVRVLLQLEGGPACGR